MNLAEIAEKLGYIHFEVILEDDYITKWYWKTPEGELIGSVWGYERDEVPDELIWHIAVYLEAA